MKILIPRCEWHCRDLLSFDSTVSHAHRLVSLKLLTFFISVFIPPPPPLPQSLTQWCHLNRTVFRISRRYRNRKYFNRCSGGPYTAGWNKRRGRKSPFMDPAENLKLSYCISLLLRSDWDTGRRKGERSFWFAIKSYVTKCKILLFMEYECCMYLTPLSLYSQ